MNWKFYILVHIALAVPAIILIYTLNYFTNKVYHNNDNDNVNDRNRIRNRKFHVIVIY